MVLEFAGFLVFIATDIDEVERIIESRNPDLLILCHTLSMEEKTVALATVGATRPQLQILTLTKTYAKLVTHNGSDVLTPACRPADLIAAANGVLNRGDRGGL
jgi:DNA-binding response OmpR family regulator